MLIIDNNNNYHIPTESPIRGHEEEGLAIRVPRSFLFRSFLMRLINGSVTEEVMLMILLVLIPATPSCGGIKPERGG